MEENNNNALFNNDKPVNPKLNGMAARMITGFLLCCIIIVFIFVLRQYSMFITDALILFFVVGACLEMNRAYKLAGYKPISWVVYITPFFTYGFYILFELTKQNGAQGIISATIFLAMLTLALFTFDHKITLQDALSTLSLIIYPTMFISMFYVLNHDSKFGLISVTIVLGCSILTDSMALFTGMSLGRVWKTKLCPHISPKKTRAGAVGGIIGGILGALLAYVLFYTLHIFDNMPYVDTAAFRALGNKLIPILCVIGLLGAIADQIGDLCASWIKRKVSIKDYSHIFPGHGGIMDRLDGMSFVLPVVYICTTLLF